MVDKVIISTQFYNTCKKLNHDHKERIIKELNELLPKLINTEITTQKSNHPVPNFNDIHLDGGSVILLYRYDTNNNLLLSLKLGYLTDHDNISKDAYAGMPRIKKELSPENAKTVDDILNKNESYNESYEPAPYYVKLFPSEDIFDFDTEHEAARFAGDSVCDGECEEAGVYLTDTNECIYLYDQEWKNDICDESVNEDSNLKNLFKQKEKLLNKLKKVKDIDTQAYIEDELRDLDRAIASYNESLNEQFTLQYINDAGDIMARDYFENEEELRAFADNLINTYEEIGNTDVRSLFISYPDGNEEEIWESEYIEESLTEFDKIKRSTHDILNNESLNEEKVQMLFRVYEVDEYDEEIDFLKSFSSLDEAVKYARSKSIPTHIVAVPPIDLDDDPDIEIDSEYEPYEIVWSSYSK